MSMQLNSKSATSDRRNGPLFIALRCPSVPKRRTVDLPFEEEGDLGLLPFILRDMPMSATAYITPLVHIPAPSPANTSPPPAAYPHPESSHVVAGVILPVPITAQATLSRHTRAEASCPRPAQPGQSPSPPRATRQERERRRNPTRSSTLSSTEDIAALRSTGNDYITHWRTSDSSFFSSSSSN